MTIIKKCSNTAEFKDFAAQNPPVIRAWQKGGRFAWKRVLVASTEKKELVIFSETLLVRVYAWFHNLFQFVCGDYYAKTLGAKKITFLAPSDLPQSAKKGAVIANQKLALPTPAPVVLPPTPLPVEIVPVSRKKIPTPPLTELLDRYQTAVSERPELSRAILELLPKLDQLPPLNPAQERTLSDCLAYLIKEYAISEQSPIWDRLAKREPTFQAITIASIIQACDGASSFSTYLKKLHAAPESAWQKAATLRAYQGTAWQFSSYKASLAKELVNNVSTAALMAFLNGLATASLTPDADKGTIISACSAYLAQSKAAALDLEPFKSLSDPALSFVRSPALGIPSFTNIQEHPWVTLITAATHLDDPSEKRLFLHLFKELMRDPEARHYAWICRVDPSNFNHLNWEEFQGSLPLCFALALRSSAPLEASRIPLLKERAKVMSKEDGQIFDSVGLCLRPNTVSYLMSLVELFPKNRLPDFMDRAFKDFFPEADAATLQTLPRDILLRYLDNVHYDQRVPLLVQMSPEEIRRAYNIWDFHNLQRYDHFPFMAVLQATHVPHCIHSLLQGYFSTGAELKQHLDEYQAIFKILEQEPWKLWAMLSVSFKMRSNRSISEGCSHLLKWDELSHYSQCAEALKWYCSSAVQADGKAFVDNLETYIEAKQWREALELLARADPMMKKCFLAVLWGPPTESLDKHLDHYESPTHQLFAALFDDQARNALQKAIQLNKRHSSQIEEILQGLLGGNDLTDDQRKMLLAFQQTIVQV